MYFHSQVVGGNWNWDIPFLDIRIDFALHNRLGASEWAPVKYFWKQITLRAYLQFWWNHGNKASPSHQDGFRSITRTFFPLLLSSTSTLSEFLSQLPLFSPACLTGRTKEGLGLFKVCRSPWNIPDKTPFKALNITAKTGWSFYRRHQIILNDPFHCVLSYSSIENFRAKDIFPVCTNACIGQ